ncbi:MAG: hypothetical protein IKR68_01465 [Lachnospiraceae bacterium]|nr:hypothetical protein [Lachnospiraceae bacterium]
MINISRDQNDPHRYDDIINAERPALKDRPPISMRDRAGQFAPFAALTGYSDMIDEAEREFNEEAE